MDINYYEIRITLLRLALEQIEKSSEDTESQYTALKYLKKDDELEEKYLTQNHKRDIL